MSFPDPIEDPEFGPRRAFYVNSFHGQLGPYDANVLLSRPPWTFTSPNRSDIPFIEVEPTELYARADGRFGPEDYILWPQNHSEAYPWAPCVLRRPAVNDIRDHQYWFLWDDITKKDWHHPPGSSWQRMGVLHPDFYNVFYHAFQPIIHRVLHLARLHEVPAYVTIGLNCLRATLARLRDLPMTYRDLVLQFTQAQRLGLDLLAMEAFHTHMFTRMIQRARIYALRSEFIGCHTNNPTTVENMYYAGIPVVYIRPADQLTPSQLRVRHVAADFLAVPLDFVTAEWPGSPCKRLHHGSSSTRRFQMSRPLGRYFEDLVPLEDSAEPTPDMRPFVGGASVIPAPLDHQPEDDDAGMSFAPDDGVDDFTAESDLQEDPPSTARHTWSKMSAASPRGHKYQRRGRPAKQQVQKNSRRGRKLAEASAAGKAIGRPMPSFQGQLLARNRDKFAPVESPLMPPYSQEWVAALRAVDLFSPTHNIPKRRTGLMYPDPAYFASVTPLNLSFALPAWLAIRATRCGQMLYPSRAEMRVLPTTVWRYFFFMYRQEPGGAGTLDTSVPSLTEQPHTALAAAKAMFGPQAVAAMDRSIREVFWRGQAYTVVDGAIQDISVEVIREIVWELGELNWRHELLALDKLAAPHLWEDDDRAGQRITELLVVFSPSSSFVLTHAPFPTEDSGIVASTRAGRLPALKALRHVMSSWRRCPDALSDSSSSTPENDIYAKVFEAKVLWMYCQTFYDYFHRAPIVPFRLP